MSELDPRTLVVDLVYLGACASFILGLRGLTRPETARRGMHWAAGGMVLAIAGTLVKHEIVNYPPVLVGLVIGSIIGWPLGTKVAMTQMPQRIAISHLFGALAATLVGVSEYSGHALRGLAPERAQMAALAFEVLFGALTVSGSFMAFAKLHELLPGRPITFVGQNAVNALLFGGAVVLMITLVVDPSAQWAFAGMVAIAFISGFTVVLPIGGADMPVVVSLLNSYAGLAASATGFAIGNKVLIVCGALDGASGFLLSILMSRAMNRSFANVLFGGFGKPPAKGLSAGPVGDMKEVSVEDAATAIRFAQQVVVVPGYGLAVAQAQKLVGEVSEIVQQAGGQVRYAIHPVAGRMPGHMNVLLAEANIPYEHMVEMEEINDSFSEVDVVLVVGANDVVNPAAKRDPKSPIFGMPVLNVDLARRVIVLKRGKGTGFAGIENALFFDDKTSLLFGDAKSTLQRLVTEMKALG